MLRLIDLAALHKLNVLHLHLTDDQGWRSRSSATAAHRGRILAEQSPSAGPEKRSTGPHGGCYTVADLAEIVAYAAQRHMTWCRRLTCPPYAAASCRYPELGQRGRLTTAAEADPRWRTRWGISRHVLNVDDTTVEFCANVLDE